MGEANPLASGEATGLASGEAKPAGVGLASAGGDEPVVLTDIDPLAAAAEPLARDAAAMFRWSQAVESEARAVFGRFLRAGYTAAQVRTVLADKRDRRINGPRYFDDVLRQAFGQPAAALPGPAPGAAPEAAAPAIRPEVRDDPEWGRLERRDQVDLSAVLDMLELPAAERDRRLSGAKSWRRAAVERVALRRPEIYDLVGWEPPRQAAAG